MLIKIWKTLFSRFWMILHLIMDKLESPSLKNTLCQVRLKLVQWFWRRRFLKFVNLFSLFRYYLPLEKGVALYWINVNPLHPRMLFAIFICHWSSGSGDFVCVGFFRSYWRIIHSYGDVMHHYRWKAANYDLCLVLIAIEQWKFFSVPHLLWHGSSVDNGHLRGLEMLAPIA